MQPQECVHRVKGGSRSIMVGGHSGHQQSDTALHDPHCSLPLLAHPAQSKHLHCSAGGSYTVATFVKEK